MKNIIGIIGAAMVAASGVVLGCLAHDDAKKKEYARTILLEHKEEIISEWWYDYSQKKYVHWPKGKSHLPSIIESVMERTGLSKDVVVKIMSETIAQWIVSMTIDARNTNDDAMKPEILADDCEFISNQAETYSALIINKCYDLDWIRLNTFSHTLIVLMPGYLGGDGGSGTITYVVGECGSGALYNSNNQPITYTLSTNPDKNWHMYYLRGNKSLKDIFGPEYDPLVIKCGDYEDAYKMAEYFINHID